MISHIPINKIKSVIIGDGLVFRPLKNTLKDVASGEIATLNNVATQLLLYLLQNGKEISSRDEILLNVFQHNGARATDANLNQHISFCAKPLRRQVILQNSSLPFLVLDFGWATSISIFSYRKKRKRPPESPMLHRRRGERNQTGGLSLSQR